MGRILPALILTAMTLANSSNAAYRASMKTVDNVEVVVLADDTRGMEVLIAPSLGMNSYSFTIHGKQVMWAPFTSPANVQGASMYGNPLLWPWANRIDGMSYTFEGRKYNFNPGLGNVRPGPANTPIHGLFVREKRWKVAAPVANAASASVTASIDFHAYPELAAQFPFAHTFSMTYSLRDGALEIETRIDNKSASAMPVSLGYHPYFKMAGTPREQWTVDLPATTRYQLTERLVPNGTTEPNPYPASIPLNQTLLDDVFGGLKRDPDGYARITVRAGAQSLAIEYGPGYDIAVVYAPKGRDFLCVEPMTAITNAFNATAAGWYKGLPVIAAGQSWSATYRIRPTGF
jgi:aldose 1-epimerase